jgi:membrane dipeptidase
MLMTKASAATRSLALLALCGASWPAPGAPTHAALEHARRLLRASPVLDGHNDLPWAIRESKSSPRDVDAYDLTTRTTGQTDLPRLRQGGIGGQFWSVYVPGEAKDSGYARIQLEQIDIARRMIAKYPDQLQLALTAADAEAAMKAGKIASFLGMEGGHAIENSLGALRAYYALGARYMTLTHNVTLDWADAALDSAKHEGLTPFGEEVVREMNRLGMLVDLSHVSPGTMSDAIRVSEAPVIFSHSSARALTDVPRDVPDSILRLLPKNGGVVMVTFVPSFVSQALNDSMTAWRPQLQGLMRDATDSAGRAEIRRQFMASHPLPKVTVKEVADHVEHVRDVAGIDHVGLGGDYDGTDALPEGLSDVSGYPNLFAELIRRGWKDADLAKLANGNILRALHEAEIVAARLQKERKPSTRTIGEMDRATP